MIGQYESGTNQKKFVTVSDTQCDFPLRNVLKGPRPYFSIICCVAFPHDTTGLSAVCDCGIAWAYSLF